VRLDAREQRLLHVQPLDHRLDDPVAGRECGKVTVEAAGADERVRGRREEGIRLERLRAFQSFAGGVARDIEQQRRNAGVGQMRRYLRPHRAGPEHRGLANVSAHATSPARRRRGR
jgi:hypothetical protein